MQRLRGAPPTAAEARDKGEFGGLVGLEKTYAFNLSGHVLPLLSASPGASWWLTTHPRASAALGLYRRRGWRVAALLNTENQVRLIMLKQPTEGLDGNG
ncbi:hypothetical protein [Nonomuraea sp. C10]|uniref:hypothetical protein n=1 Tax=Nonomuraea sp. C10 TaxID=2600577 RepID=UPI0021C28755|nr:hypothetical protein [Nonomuraea sp. C10]